MTSKTFKSVVSGGKDLLVRQSDGHVALFIRITDLSDRDIHVAPSDAPALALAILEAAGGREYVGSGDDVGLAVENLDKHIAWLEKHAAAAREQAELEAEALEYYKKFTGYTHTTLDSACSPDKWLAVARKARELADKRAEK